jgi:porin
MEERGVALNGCLTADASRLFSGGLEPCGSAFRSLLDLSITLDLEQLIGLKGGTAFAKFQQINGSDGSARVGDYQGFDNVDAPHRTQFAEAWYEQLLANKKLRLKVGKVDANSEFAYVKSGTEFINSSMGYDPTIFVMPTYPDPAMSVNLFVDPNEHLHFGLGWYDGGAQRGIPTGSLGPSTFFSNPAGRFLIGEASANWKLGRQDKAGRLAIGAWRHSGEFETFEGTRTLEGAGGYYIVAEQAAWKENPSLTGDEQGLAVFVQFGRANENVSEISWHLGAGLTWAGPIPGRDEDLLGLGFTCVHFSGKALDFTASYENSVELFYKAKITAWCDIKPELQYITNPGGQAASRVLVGTLRLQVAW